MPGTELKLDSSQGVKVDGATVISAAIPASNGMIHMIESMVMLQ